MIKEDTRQIIRSLYSQGKRKKEIARILEIDPKTVRSILRGQRDAARIRKDKKRIDIDLLRETIDRAGGYLQRVHEILTEERGIQISYPTLTRLVRRSGLKDPKKLMRHPSVGDSPGEEMQHDTAVYWIKLAGKAFKLILSGLYLRYSKMRYIKFYPYFNRFLMKCFFHEALMFWGYSAGRCVIDNTNLAVLHGTGKEAVFHPEMIQFAKPFGFEWFAHEKGHANRKAGKERNFWTVTTNFLPGRSFNNLVDLNRQAFDWAAGRYARRPQSKTRLIPIDLFETEKPYLIKLPSALPPPSRELYRTTDQKGYVAVNANYYWIPGKARPETKIIEYEKRIRIYPDNQDPIEYDLPDWTVRNQKYSPKGADPNPYGPRNLKKKCDEEETRLRELGQLAADYLGFIKSPESGIRCKVEFIRRLYDLKKKLSESVFKTLLERAFKYRITHMESLLRISRRVTTESCRDIPFTDERLSDDYIQRPSFQEGRFCEENPMERYKDLYDPQDSDQP